MPEERATYTIPCSRCDGTGLVNRTARGAKTCPDCGGSGKVEQETELICPLRMMQYARPETPEVMSRARCLKDKCAWWTYNAYGDKCALAAIAEYGLGLRA